MCFALLALNQHPDYPLILAANRDEYYARPALGMHEWEDEANVLAGRDLESKGTWLALNKQDGRIALVTNVRQGLSPEPAELSRGKLVRDLVANQKPVHKALLDIDQEKHRYGAFNLLAGTAQQMHYSSNRNQQAIKALANGVYGLSNAVLDTPWPKVVQGKLQLQQLLEKRQTALADRLFDLLADPRVFPDHELPDTGIGLENERWLSPVFIKSEGYGTRCSTVILMNRDNEVLCQERSFSEAGEAAEQNFIFTIDQ